MTFIVLEEPPRNKVAKHSSWGLGRAGWTRVSLADNTDPNVPGWWVSTLVLCKVCHQVPSMRWETVFSCGVFFFLPFTQAHDVLLVSKQIFFLCCFQAARLWVDILYLFRSEMGAPWLKSHENRCEIVDLRPYLDFIRRFWVGVWAGMILTSLRELWLQEGWQGGGEEAGVVCRTEGWPGRTCVSPHESQD